MFCMYRAAATEPSTEPGEDLPATAPGENRHRPTSTAEPSTPNKTQGNILFLSLTFVARCRFLETWVYDN